MKIVPITTAQAGNPLQNVSINRSGSSSERLAAAVSAATGQAQDAPKVSGDPQVDRINDVRRIKMKTVATPASREYAPVKEQTVISDPIEQAQPVTEATQPLSPQFAALAKSRRALQVKERELADREKALETKSTTEGSSDLIARLKSQPLSVLQEHGVTYDQLTQAILGQQLDPEILSLKEEIKALKAGVDKSFIDRDTIQENAVLTEMQREANSLIKQGDQFEMVRETQNLPKVMDLIKRTYKSTGEVLEVSDALQLVEDALIEDNLKIASIKKLQGKLPKATQSIPQQQNQMKSLSNRDGVTSSLSRKERALAAALGTLKK